MSSYSDEGGECRTPLKKRNYGQLNDGSNIHLRKDYGVDELDDDGLGNLAQDIKLFLWRNCKMNGHFAMC